LILRDFINNHINHNHHIKSNNNNNNNDTDTNLSVSLYLSLSNVLLDLKSRLKGTELQTKKERRKKEVLASNLSNKVKLDIMASRKSQQNSAASVLDGCELFICSERDKEERKKGR
jgi:hypothetical protein